MKLITRCLPLGALPYDSIDIPAKMAAKLFEKMPFLAELPKVDEKENIITRTLENFPGVKVKDGKIILNTSSPSYKRDLHQLDIAFNNPTKENLEHFYTSSAYMDKFFSLIKKFKSPYAVVNILGPFTLSQKLMQAAEEQVLVDKSFRKLFIQGLCVKALWFIEKIKEINPETIPLIILEEPSYSLLGDVRRNNEEITIELVTTMFSRVIEKLKEAGALVGIQCLEKCDWKIPINAGVDLISFDAYNNPNNLNIIPEHIIDFVARGGKINWAIVPVRTEAIVKSLNIDYLANRLFATMQGLILAGVSEKFVYNSAMVSVQGNVDKLPVIFAEKAIILANQLSKRIPIKK